MPANIIARCTPTLGFVSLWWCRAVETILWPTGSCGKSLFYLRDHKGGEIAEVRNGIVDAVLRYDRDVGPVSHLFWIDDDVLTFPGCLLSLLHHDCDIASGVYFTKRPGKLSEPLIYSDPHGSADLFKPDQAYPVFGHGMGLTLIRTSVYKRMFQEIDLAKDKYGRPQWYHTVGIGESWEDEKGIIHTEQTEDFYFLSNVAKLGIKPMIDTSKHAFGFHYQPEYCCSCGLETPHAREARSHKRDNPTHSMALEDRGYPQEQWTQWIKGERITWTMPDDSKVIWD